MRLRQLPIVLLAGSALLPASAGAVVKRWGSYGAFGQALTPTPVPGATGVTALEGGNASSYALTSSGGVLAWGLNNHGQLGVGTIDEEVHSVAVPVAFPKQLRLTAIGEAQAEGMAIDSTGRGWGWGFGLDGSLCMRGKDIATPKPNAIKGATAVQGGEGRSVWLMANGTVRACGRGNHGQLGDGRFAGSSTPVTVVGLEHVVEVSAGQYQSCARTREGHVFTWGGNTWGQLGNGKQEDSAVPVRVALPGPASYISCGGSQPNNGHSLAIVGGEVFGWGNDRFGQVGDGRIINKSLPVATGIHCAKVVASGYSSICLDGAGNVFTWGAGFGGALGDGNGRLRLKPGLIDKGASLISGTSTNAVDGP